MRLLIVLAFLSTCYGSNDLKLIKKRGIFDDGLYLGGIHDLGTGIDLSSHDVPLQVNNLEIPKYDYGIDLGSTSHKHMTVTHNIGVPIAIPVQIPKPFPIEKPYPVPVEKAVPYHISVPVKVPLSVPVAVPVPKPVLVPIHKAPYAIAEPVNAFKAVSIVKTPVVAIGSGSLGYTHLGNGAYALGSGSLGISGHAVNGALNSVSKQW